MAQILLSRNKALGNCYMSERWGTISDQKTGIPPHLRCYMITKIHCICFPEWLRDNVTPDRHKPGRTKICSTPFVCLFSLPKTTKVLLSFVLSAPTLGIASYSQPGIPIHTDSRCHKHLGKLSCNNHLILWQLNIFSFCLQSSLICTTGRWANKGNCINYKKERGLKIKEVQRWNKTEWNAIF